MSVPSSSLSVLEKAYVEVTAVLLFGNYYAGRKPGAASASRYLHTLDHSEEGTVKRKGSGPLSVRGAGY